MKRMLKRIFVSNAFHNAVQSTPAQGQMLLTAPGFKKSMADYATRKRKAEGLKSMPNHDSWFSADKRIARRMGMVIVTETGA